MLEETPSPHMLRNSAINFNIASIKLIIDTCISLIDPFLSKIYITFRSHFEVFQATRKKFKKERSRKGEKKASFLQD